MDKAVLVSKIKELSNLANKLHGFEDDEESFLVAIKGLDRKYLEGELEKFREGSISWNGVLKPVNFLKFLVIDKVLDDKDVSLEIIDEFKDRILKLDVDYFKDYPDFKEAMLKLEKGKNFFWQWNNIFKILFYVYYDQHKDSVNSSLTEIADHFKTVLNMKDSKTTINGFGWNNNYGSSDCWIALYPPDRDSHQKAYQIFLRVNPVNELVYGMTNGAKIAENKKLEKQDGSNVDVDKLEKFLFEKAKPEYEKLNASVKPEPDEEEVDEELRVVDEKCPKNVILYGPPGTGKTYMAYEEAVRIVDPSFSWKDRKALVAKFREFQDSGYITFVTFHQSFSYEEFIEGFRYDKEEKMPMVESGVFKTLVESARSDYVSPKKKIDLNLAKRNVFKMSLGNTLKEDEDIYDFCMQEDIIAIGWGQDVNYTGADTKEKVAKKFKEHEGSDKDSVFNVTAIHFFKNIMKKDDLVFVSKGNRSLRAIGRVVGEYYYDENVPINYRHFRKVEWLLTDSNIPVEKVMKKNFSQQTIYEISKSWLLEQNLQELLAKPADNKKEVRNYVLIIDEINRGNISKIFGELITLIEDDKRLGMENEMVVKLPYSKEIDFGIPPNIYVIGTMNTADRSIALMDVALRRRFSFKRIAPESKIISDLLSEKEVDGDFIEILQKSFIALNKRIKVLLDEDHVIGHSYFLKIGPEDFEYDLHAVWYDKIIPLLQEYFYNDWDKLRLVLGEHNSQKRSGFIKVLEAEYKGIFGSEFDEEYPCEIVRYEPDLFSQVLKNTFIG